MLYFVPLGGARREVADGDLQPGVPGQVGQGGLPRPGPVPVAPAGVGGDQQPPRLRVAVLPQGVPPAADGLDRERGGVMVSAHIHEPVVRGDVAGPVRGHLPGLLIGEVMVADRHRIPPGPPLLPGLGVLADLLLLLGIHADHRLARGDMRLCLLADVAELSVAVGVLAALDRLGVGLQAVAIRVQQPRRRLPAAPVPLRGQLIRQVLQRLRRPHQRRLRIPPRAVFHQRQQRGLQTRVRRSQRLAPPARTAHPALRGALARGQLRGPVRDRLPGRPGHPGHRRDPAVPRGPRHRAQRQPPGLLIQRRQQQLQLRPHQPQKFRIRAHYRILTRDTPVTHLIPGFTHIAEKLPRS